MKFSKEEQAKEDAFAADLKYHAARTVWKVRHKKTPRGRLTWAQWFEDKFGESLNDYAVRMKNKKSK